MSNTHALLVRTLVLVVDDEESIRQITKSTLETFGYRTVTHSARSGSLKLNISIAQSSSRSCAKARIHRLLFHPALPNFEYLVREELKFAWACALLESSWREEKEEAQLQELLGEPQSLLNARCCLKRKRIELWKPEGAAKRPHSKAGWNRLSLAKQWRPNPAEVRYKAAMNGHEIKLAGETGEACGRVITPNRSSPRKPRRSDG